MRQPTWGQASTPGQTGRVVPMTEASWGLFPASRPAGTPDGIHTQGPPGFMSKLRKVGAPVPGFCRDVRGLTPFLEPRVAGPREGQARVHQFNLLGLMPLLLISLSPLAPDWPHPRDLENTTACQGAAGRYICLPPIFLATLKRQVLSLS